MNSTLFWILLVLPWTSTLAFAGAVVVTIGRQPLELDWPLVGVSVVLTTMAGATALAIRVNNMLLADPTKPLVRPWLLAAAHMLGSWSAGTAGFLLGQLQGMDVWASLLLVLLAAFVGAKFLESLADRWMAVIRGGGP